MRSLGPDLPVAEFATTATQCGADVVAISIVSLPQPQIDEHLHQRGAPLPPAVELWLGGRGARDVEPPSGVRLVGQLEELRQHSRLII